MKCGVYRFLFGIVPLRAWRLFLLNRHLDSCPQCREKFDIQGSLPAMLVTPDRVSGSADIWPGIERGLSARQQPDFTASRGRAGQNRRFSWAAAATAAALVVALAWLALRLGSGGAGKKPEVAQISTAPGRVQLVSARIEDGPARVYSFQSRNPDRAIFFIKKERTRS